MQRAAWNSLLTTAVAQLGWLDPGNVSRNPWHAGEHCLLSQLLATVRLHPCNDSRCEAARRELCLIIGQRLYEGFTLRSHVPHVEPYTQRDWLGGRMVFMHSHWLTHSAKWTCLVSSRLGRYGQQLANWPSVLAAALRTISTSNLMLLTVPQTTVAALIEPLLACSAIPCVRVQLPPANVTDVIQWLSELLEEPDRDRRYPAWINLHVSPAITSALPELAARPLQDRVSICWGGRVRALHIRPGGAIDSLLKRRLSDPSFQSGTVSMLISTRGQSYRPQHAEVKDCLDQSAWLNRGGVGWVVLPKRAWASAQVELSSHCSNRSAGASSLVQWTSPYALCFSADQNELSESPRYLVHCVRGSQGRLPQESAADFLTRAWVAGQLHDETPLGSLFKILQSGRLRSGNGLTRGAERCVSFSAVRLDQLVARRRFQSHLGRWDWEPYGLMIERAALERMGARPVIYGGDADYRQLRSEEQPFFQLARRRRARAEESHWEDEREWRVLGDIRLGELPRSAVHIFVAYEHQAQSLARTCHWPVIWLQADRTQERPGYSKCRPRRAAQINRN